MLLFSTFILGHAHKVKTYKQGQAVFFLSSFSCSGEGKASFVSTFVVALSFCGCWPFCAISNETCQWLRSVKFFVLWGTRSVNQSCVHLLPNSFYRTHLELFCKVVVIFSVSYR